MTDRDVGSNCLAHNHHPVKIMPQEWGILLKRKPTKYTLLSSFAILHLPGFIKNCRAAASRITGPKELTGRLLFVRIIHHT
jgi:hypothetical protein